MFTHAPVSDATRSNKTLYIVTSAPESSWFLLIRLFQQTAIDSMNGCLDRDFPKACGSFNGSLPPKRHANNIWPPVAGRMGSSVRNVETDAPMNWRISDDGSVSAVGTKLL